MPLSCHVNSSINLTRCGINAKESILYRNSFKRSAAAFGAYNSMLMYSIMILISSCASGWITKSYGSNILYSYLVKGLRHIVSMSSQQTADERFRIPRLELTSSSSCKSLCVVVFDAHLMGQIEQPKKSFPPLYA